MKNFIAMLHGSCAIVQRKAIKLTINIEAAGSWQLGRIMVSLFFLRLLLLVVVFACLFKLQLVLELGVVQLV